MKYNHLFTIAFSVETTNLGDKVTKEELLAGIARRLADLIEHDEILEAVELIDDSYEVVEV